ncbi:MAG: hypothetical protein LBL42_01175 [Tannerella sp.]|nr:hypothetical protein [Tannerella sp.]
MMLYGGRPGFACGMLPSGSVSQERPAIAAGTVTRVRVCPYIILSYLPTGYPEPPGTNAPVNSREDEYVILTITVI